MNLPSARNFTFLMSVEHRVLDLVLVQQRLAVSSCLLVARRIVVMLDSNQIVRLEEQRRVGCESVRCRLLGRADALSYLN